MPANIIRAFKG